MMNIRTCTHPYIRTYITEYKSYYVYNGTFNVYIRIRMYVHGMSTYLCTSYVFESITLALHWVTPECKYVQFH